MNTLDWGDAPLPDNVTPRGEFSARRLAQSRMIDAGKRALGNDAARLAAKLFRAGKGCDHAAQIAAQRITQQSTGTKPEGGAA